MTPHDPSGSFWDHLLAFLCPVPPDDVGTVLPNDLGQLLPDDLGQVLPDDVGPVLPDDVGPVLPDDVGPVPPDDVGPVPPGNVGPVLPDEMGPVLPDGFGAPTALPADSGMRRSFPLFAAAYRAFSYPGYRATRRCGAVQHGRRSGRRYARSPSGPRR
jgi:hypothetical protein